ncbi:hypothetical protein E8E13_009585 [Curvularia kusanoi]|uniref:RNA ligase/cyclic nucleotide phosphodiesterase n=1 Tax=Curvularia kusanoi TaxID=90978 RepID=A0A9P4TEP2_CURKU|nr:hypothetical protein E8E13_009585 [Curvularia kusanoi]
MTKFSYRSLAEGPPSYRNYADLLDDPGCNGDSTRIQEAYETHRDTWRAKQIELFSTTETNPVKPNQALIKHLARQERLRNGRNLDEKDQTDNQKMNCCVVWARPPAALLDQIQRIQDELLQLVGDDLYLIPRADLHISVIELSHRRTLPDLRSVSDQIGLSRIQKILDHVSTLSAKPRLVAPTISFDKAGITLNFLPSTTSPYTYHHLRSDMHAIALESGIEIDRSPTAPSAHITIGKFTDNRFFETTEARRGFVQLIQKFNEVVLKDQDGWIVGENQGLELHMGYLKFGRECGRADLVGKA